MMKKNQLWITLILFLILLGIAVILYEKNEGSSTIPEELRDFSIQDTSNIEKIFIADQDGNEILLKRTVSDGWTVNGKYQAQKHKVKMLLSTFEQMRAKKPVSDAYLETVLKNMSAINKKVEVYKKNDKDQPNKIYYLGTATKNHDGTYMLLETPEHGKADRPFVVHIPYRRGYLNPRFFTDIDQWRFTGVFNYKVPNIKKVVLINNQDPNSSFYIRYHGGNNIELYRRHDDKRIHDFDTLRVKDYLTTFKKAHVETYDHGLEQQKVDSILSTTPSYRLLVIDQAGDTSSVSLYPKYIKKEKGTGMKKDVDRRYGYVNEGEFAIVQNFVFGRYLQPLSELRKDYSNKARSYRNIGPKPPQGFDQVDKNGPKKKKPLKDTTDQQ